MAHDAETPGIPNATFGGGSVKVESTEPIVGRVINMDCYNGSFVSMAAQEMVEPSNAVNEQGKYEVYAAWFYESVSNAGGGSLPLNGKLTFICLVNASDAGSTVSITYLSPNESTPDEGPFELTLPAGGAITWTPYSTATGAETPGIPNATFPAGSVKIESTQPVVGRVIMVDCNNDSFVSMAGESLAPTSSFINERGKFEVYAPWFYESVSNAGGGSLPLNGKLTFVCLVNTSDEENTASITYLSPNDTVPDEGPFDVTLPAGGAITWTPHSTATGAETPGIPNATFGAGSVKIESTRPVVGRAISMDCQNNLFISMADQQLVERSQLVNDHDRYEVYAPWFYESVSNAGGGSLPLNGKLTFVCLVNASPLDATATARITYLSPDENTPDEGPFDILLGRGAAITWTPHSTASGAETPGIPNGTFGAGSVKIESTEPLVGRVISVDCQNTSFVSMAAQPLVERSRER
jgi:hypothetical protein